MELTPAEASHVHIWAMRDYVSIVDPVFWLRTKQEWETEKAEVESILAKCEAILRAAGQWASYNERYQHVLKEYHQRIERATARPSCG